MLRDANACLVLFHSLPHSNTSDAVPNDCARPDGDASCDVYAMLCDANATGSSRRRGAGRCSRSRRG
jgi:hypothetical protein